MVNNRIIDKSVMEKYFNTFFKLNFNWLDFICFIGIKIQIFYKDNTKNVLFHKSFYHFGNDNNYIH